MLPGNWKWIARPDGVHRHARPLANISCRLGTISSALRLLSKKDLLAVDPDQDLLDKMDRKEGLSGPLPIAAGIAILSMAGAVAYFTLKLQLNASDAAVDVVMLVLIGSLALIAIFRSRFS